MDEETKNYLADIYTQLKMLNEQVADARAHSLAVKLALTQSDPDFQGHFLHYYHQRESTELKLQAENVRVTLDAVIRRLKE